MHHIILKGASGNGKTYLVCVLGNAACRKFKSVKYIRMPELLDELNVAKGCGTFKKTIKSYKKIEDKFVNNFLKKDGETIEEAKKRIQEEKNIRYNNIK